jgi:beta-lactamase regulating signal transducer with metallopeptidase domain
MGANLLHALIGATVASSLAMLLVGLLRVPLRSLVGARAAYWLWLLMPATVLATLLPAPTGILEISSRSLTDYVGSTLSGAVVTADRTRTFSIYAVLLVAIWAAGVAVMLGVLLRRHRTFIQSLGKLTQDEGNTQRSASIVAPMLVGAWRSSVILPVDFETRYSEAERELMLAHEHAHLLRNDVLVNIIAAAWLCIFWFNPLMYWAIGRLRLDQELACDAIALVRTGAARHLYADALLKTQLASEYGWQMPVECRWQSGHPLKERVAMLKRHTPGLFRRIGGVTFVLALTVSGSYAAWAAQSASEGGGAQVFVGITMTTWTAHSPLSDPPGTDVHALTTAYVVRAGEETPAFPTTQPFNVKCVPFLPQETGQSQAELPSGGMTHPADGQISLQCKITFNGQVVATPSLIALDGQPTSMKIDDGGRTLHYQLVVTASTSKERFEAAKDAHDSLTREFLAHRS